MADEGVRQPMTVTEAVRSRKSVRAFLDRPVDPALLREAIELAARAPSGGNLQPWHLHVLAGEPLQRLKDTVQGRGGATAPGDMPEYDIYPKDLPEPYRTERYVVGEQMYALLGVPREDKPGRLRQFQRNFDFFGAPVGLFCFVDRRMGKPQWSDLGMYLQTLMLLLRERGLHSCPQECWAIYPKTISAFVQAPAEQMLFCGMAIGYPDETAPVNRLESRRIPVEGFASFSGF